MEILVAWSASLLYALHKGNGPPPPLLGTAAEITGEVGEHVSITGNSQVDLCVAPPYGYLHRVTQVLSIDISFKQETLKEPIAWLKKKYYSPMTANN